jgi:uncharacterized membrane protein YjjP (DUF1212 family)
MNGPQTAPGFHTRTSWPFPKGSVMSEKKEEDPYMMNTKGGTIRSQQMYMVALAKALLIYGAPTHRVEWYMERAATCLGLQAKVFYMPDHFILSFDDETSYKSDFQLVKGAGSDLSRFEDAHKVYKLVNHNFISVDEGLYRLEMLEQQGPLYSNWFLFLIYGLAAIGIGPFAYQARFIDLPISFTMGTLLGVFQLKFVPANPLYHRIFEISTAILMSFLGRLVGSIRNAEGTHIFCYSAITQSCINLILPGYWITNAGLELMNHQIVAGGTRIMHAIIYFLFLAYGITMGSALYGFIDSNAVSSPVCRDTMDRHWNLLFVPFFSIQVAIINRAKARQIPVMVFISFMGYAANFVTVNIFNGSFTLATSIGGFVIGLLGNLYSRFGNKVEDAISGLFGLSKYGDDIEQNPELANALRAESQFVLAASAMVPAMIVQVPSGLAAIGAVLTAVTSADAIVRNETANALTGPPVGEVQLSGFPVLLNVIQIAISIGFGLGFASLLVYPAPGKKKGGIMSW